MKLKELYESVNFYSLVEVRSGFNGKMLCRNFDPKKHNEIGERELVSMWADTKKHRNDPGAPVCPVLCCYVDGRPEYEKEEALKDGDSTD